MFKYVAFLLLILVCLIVLQRGCNGIGDRFRKRMDDFQERRREAIDDRRQRWGDRFHRMSDGDERGFGRRWRERKKETNITEGD